MHVVPHRPSVLPALLSTGVDLVFLTHTLPPYVAICSISIHVFLDRTKIDIVNYLLVMAYKYIVWFYIVVKAALLMQCLESMCLYHREVTYMKAK